MKTKFMHNGKKAVSLLLTIMLILSTFIIGTISVSATINDMDVLYFVPNDNWLKDNAKFRFIEQDGSSYKDFECIDSTNHVYKVSLASKTHKGFKIQRLSSSGVFLGATSDCTYLTNADDNCFTMKSTVTGYNWGMNDSSNGSWSKLTPFESAPYIAGQELPGGWNLKQVSQSTEDYYYINSKSGITSTDFKVSITNSWDDPVLNDNYDVAMSDANGVELTLGQDAKSNKTAEIKEPTKYDAIQFRAVKATGKVYCVAIKSVATVSITVPTVANAEVKITYNNKDYKEGETATVPVGLKFKVSVSNVTSGYSLSKITYGTNVKNTSPAEFTATANVKTFSVALSQQLAETVNVILPGVPNATVKVEYVKADNTTVTVTDTNTTGSNKTLAVKKGSNFTVKVSDIKSGYQIESITFNSVPKNTATASFTASDAGTISVTLSEITVTGSDWYLSGSMNDWSEEKDNFISTATEHNYELSRYFEANTYQFKIYHKTENSENKYFGNVTANMTATSEYTNTVASNAGSGDTYNFKWIVSTPGTYTFKYDTTNGCKLTITSVSNALTATLTGEDSVELGKNYNAIATATPDSSITTQIDYYNYIFQVGKNTPVTSKNIKSTTFNRNIEVTTTGKVYVTVEAYSKSGTCIAKSAQVSKDVEVTVGDFDVTIAASVLEAEVNGSVTLTATATPTSYVSATNPYQFQIKGETDTKFTNIGSASSSKTYTHKFANAGTYQFRVGVKTKANPNSFTYSNPVTVKVYPNLGKHPVTFYFKSSTTFAYQPYVQLDGNRVKMTRDTWLGTSYSGSVTFYWYKCEFAEVDSTVNHTVRFTTERTSMNAVVSSRLFENTYYIGVDNLMSGTKAVNLTNEEEYIRNYHRAPLHMVYAGYEDGELGKTYVKDENGNYVEVRMGEELATGTVSIKSATMAQKISAEVGSYSQLQTQVLDVNLDGTVDVMDATMIQKALVSA